MEKEKKIIDEINKILKEYNLSNGTNLYVSDKSKEYDASAMFICQYDEEKIGLFKKTSGSKPINLFHDELVYNVYTGLDSDNIGIFCKNLRVAVGETITIKFPHVHTFISTCNINKVMSYNDIRFKMYAELDNKNTNIINFEKTNTEEISQILMYAHRTLGKEHSQEKRKTL